MDRRTFVAASASAIGLTAGAGALLARGDIRGERVILSGWVEPVAKGPGHLFRLRADQQGAGEAIVVLPSDASAMRSGKVTVQGRLFRAKFRDETTGHTGSSVLTDATLV